YLKLKIDGNYVTNVEENLSTIFHELEVADKGYELITKVCTIRILNSLEGKSESYITTIPRKVNESKFFNVLTEYIKDNIAEVNIEKLRRRFHYQNDYYNRLIRKNTGLTFSEYIRVIKLEKAKHLLLNTNMTIN